MSCTLSQESIEKTIAFHGHSCPGLTIGLRAAELALQELGHTPVAQRLAVVETDMCGVDAVQCLTGCTFGKGNLIHKDYGKMAFSFYDRRTGKGFRAVLKPGARGDIDAELGSLMRKLSDGSATDQEKSLAGELRARLQDRFLSLTLKEMFDVQAAASPAPSPARILDSLECADCGEKTMESRTRRFAGRTLCIPCFAKVEQKV